MNSSKNLHFRYCAVCKKKYGKGSGSLFQVPIDIEEREEWCKIFGVQFAKSARVCSEHFLNTRIRIIGRKAFLLSNAGPINALVKDSVNHIKCDNSTGQSNTFTENQQRVFASNINFLPPQLVEPEVQMPVIKKVVCTGFTQTNIRLCGLVEASDITDEFRFSCFYCCRVFPLDKWKIFINHLKEKHSKDEEAFKTSKYLSQEHDYTPISLPPPSLAKTVLADSINSSLVDPLGSVPNRLKFSVFNNKKKTDFIFRFRQKSNNTFKKNLRRKRMSSSRYYSKLSKKQYSQRSALIRCLKRTTELELKSSTLPPPEFDESYETTPKIATEIAFDYTPRPIVNLLLDSMKSFQVLWQFDNKPFNEDFFEAAEDLCNRINNKFSVNIDNLKMRRSINRILRFYCSTYPNDNNDPLAYYYDKCASFLPPVNDIAYARCSHCYVCFASDFDLKLHLDKEQTYLEWPYKCPQCKECFRLLDEFELHKQLPHYGETLRCQPCELSFFHRSSYIKHMVEKHPSKHDSEEFKCDLCDKVLLSASDLRCHKKAHGEAIYKCHLCPRAYHEKSYLKPHLKVHLQEYDFMCEICGEKFARQTSLRRHMAKHTGEKVTCKICNLRLRKSSLKRHLKTVHVPQAGPLARHVVHAGKRVSLGKLLSSSKPSRRRKTEGPSERHYKCKDCQITFDNYKLVAEHNKELHSDRPKFPCQMCATEFNAKLNLKAHYRKKHILHPLQIFKLVELKASLDEVLSLDLNSVDEIYEDLKLLRNNPENKKSLDNRSPIKAELLPDEIYFKDEEMPSSTIQDEIMKVDAEVGCIETQNVKFNYENNMLTEFLEEE